MKIGVCGNIALVPLATAVDQILPGHEIVVGRTDAFREELASPFGDFATLELCIVALDWRELVPNLYSQGFGDDVEAILAEFDAVLAEIRACMEAYRHKSPARFLLCTPISAALSPAGFIDRLLQPSPSELFMECQKRFNAVCRSLVDVYPLDLDAMSRRLGLDQVYDPISRNSEAQPFSPAMLEVTAHTIAQICTQLIKAPLKCLVLDLDNTLWGGIVGEDGFERLLLSDRGPGRAFKDFQAEIIKLYKQGIILAVCSKNNTCDALDVLERHPHMLIRPRMISSFRINWDDKPKSILGISAELNIGLDAMMFVDDNPAEREMVRAALPDVAILDLPPEPAHYAEALNRCSRFWPVQLTTDDARKGQYFSQEQLRRQQAELAANVEAYLMRSAIKVRIAPADAYTLPRITQLFNKTNQFNLTTIRYSQGELERLTKDNQNLLLYMEMADAYGEYGIIGAVLVLSDAIDSFILSCRAFGKQAEAALLSHLLQLLKGKGLPRVTGRFVASHKNSMVKDFYASHGFTLKSEAHESSVWEFDLQKEIPSPPAWIRVNPV